jgi:N-acetylmuramoyl-L-alanine amidase
MRRRTGNRLDPLRTGVFLAWVIILASALLNGLCVPAGEDRPAAGGLAGRVIVLDPGHGGRDPGTNRAGVLEKDIVLDIGLMTRDLLRAAGAVVVMTRETDVDYSEPLPGRKKISDLEARLQMVQDVQPDVYLSIHVNSFPSSRWRGPQVFYNEKHTCNHLLATMLQEELTAITGADRTVRPDTRQFLLKSIEVPAACAEVGFITNPEDLSYIRSRQGQREIAWALCAGLARFLEQATRPAGTR